MPDRILHDQYVNVFYSHEEPKDKRYKKYRHMSVYIPSGRKTEKTVYCENEKDHQALVNNWNRISVLQSPAVWLYYIP